MPQRRPPRKLTRYALTFALLASSHPGSIASFPKQIPKGLVLICFLGVLTTAEASRPRVKWARVAMHTLDALKHGSMRGKYNWILQNADAGDLHFEIITRTDGAYPGRSARHDSIAWQKRHEPAQISNDVSH